MSIERATLGGGCFWCLETIFNRFKGIKSVISGYEGGATIAPTYEEICTGKSGHAEVVQIEFDTGIISFMMLLDIFFTIHNPTTLNRQGNDTGTQYRSVVFYHSQEQKDSSELAIKELEISKQWPDPIVTELKQHENFYPAEDYHQDYFQNNPNNSYCNYIIPSKFEKIVKKYKGENFI
ncbi:Peptide-methionine (S)-S-oxide reductase MsrA [hydrothermal vent metagenome]|uniref:peptide-methionine (S)-S-oxide reductase n=1 Tax=hydrothermal vent metagenome TaxID=652676 RepID=A0A3B0YHU6_9ZZZZ